MTSKSSPKWTQIRQKAMPGPLGTAFCGVRKIGEKRKRTARIDKPHSGSRSPTSTPPKSRPFNSLKAEGVIGRQRSRIFGSPDLRISGSADLRYKDPEIRRPLESGIRTQDIELVICHALDQRSGELGYYLGIISISVLLRYY